VPFSDELALVKSEISHAKSSIAAVTNLPFLVTLAELAAGLKAERPVP
jgi:hypothetical protein